ncbi:flagellar assembly protein FliH [Aestuariibacter sp. A3R04]|uniref:flagellar assembly protein FliH n=1 Tax=Aestuariibacter sp. A3R04 TaxID=2841571 RepID=UPI001C0A2A11|nr:flagellar assembly protein FliH [Aestuariibacter sp. A3R04]MBU3022209.1 flagellar assembly protein FliH [Aestuariibacter sp. A3R04]
MSDKPHSDDEFLEAKSWDLPFLSVEKSAEEQGKTNALNRRSDWKYEPPEPEEEEIQPPTMEEIEAIRQAAHDEGFNEGKQAGFEQGQAAGFEEGKQAGYAEGLQLGKDEGLQQGEAHINELASAWSALADNLAAPLAQVNDDTRRQLVKLAVALSRAVVRTEVTTNESCILQALSEGLKALPASETNYQIAMHPDDIELVKSHYGEDSVSEKGWQLIETPAMARGGCDITTAQNAVDVSIERRCRDVLDKFLLEQGLANE